jgi:adenylate cyclase
MAFWNAPIDVPNHSLRACEAAVAMRQVLRALNDSDGFGLQAERGPGAVLSAGIGIAAGPVLVGNMGLTSRFDYSCIGDAVNTASRIESGCKEVRYDILVTGAVRRDAAELAFLYAGALQMKGKSHREPSFILVGDGHMAKSAAFVELEGAHEDAVLAMREGRDATAAIARCLGLAPAVEPGLVTFYGAMAARGEDFAVGMIQPAAPSASGRAPVSSYTGTA